MAEKRTAEDTSRDSLVKEQASSSDHELGSDFVEGPEWKGNDESQLSSASRDSLVKEQASSSDHELGSDFVEGPEWKGNDDEKDSPRRLFPVKKEKRLQSIWRGSQSSEDTYQLQGKDAAVACHFLENELIKMGTDCDCISVRLPAIGIPDLVLIRCQNPSMEKKLKGLFQDMMLEIQSFPSQEVQFLEDQSETVQKFIAENTSKDVLLYRNPKDNPAVFIYSKNSNMISNVCHRLKVELGIIKPTGRRGQEFSSQNDGTMSDTGNFGGSSVYDSSSGGIYPKLSSLTAHSDTNFEFRLSDNLLVKVYNGSITRVKVDAIVNAANDTLQHAVGVARVIEDAAGEALTDESRNYIRTNGNLKVGDVCFTTAGRMQYKSVMHAVGPQWYKYTDKSECLRDLYATICAVLLKADKEEYEKIAMPAISAGIFGVPKDLCTDMYVRAAVKYSEDRKTHQAFLREFHIVDLDTEILQDIRASWEKWQKDPQAIDPENAADEYAKKHGNIYTSHGQGRGHRDHRQWPPSSMKSMNYDVKLGDETLSMVKVVYIGKEDKLGRVMQQFQLGQELVIKIYRGSLVNTFQLDALVTSISSKGEKGYLGKLVADAGGLLYQKSFDDEKRKKGYLKPGDIFMCNSGDIHVGCIINVIIDRLQSMMGSDLNNYRLVIKNFLKNVNDLKNVKTMVMPLLGSGSLKVPSDDLDRCCSAFVEALSEFCFDRPKPSIKEIHIINDDEIACTSLEKTFRKMSTASSDEISDGRGWMEKANTSSSRRGTEESISGMGSYDDAFSAGSSSDNLSRSVSESNSHRNPGGHDTGSVDPFDTLAMSRAKVHVSTSVQNVGSGSDKHGDQDEQISNDEDSDDGKDKGDTITSKPKPPAKKIGNIHLINS